MEEIFWYEANEYTDIGFSSGGSLFLEDNYADLFDEKVEEIDPQIFRNLPEDMLNLVLEYAGPEAMSVSRSKRRLFKRNGVKLRPFARVEKPIHEGLYLLLPYIKDMEYKYFYILCKSFSTDLPKLEVLRINGGGRDLNSMRLDFCRMPNLKRIIFRPIFDSSNKKYIYGMDPFKYFSRITDIISTKDRIFIDAALEYNGTPLREQFLYRKITVKQRLLKGLICSIKDSASGVKKMTKLKIYATSYEVLDTLADEELILMRDSVDKLVLFFPSLSYGENTSLNIAKLKELYERYKTLHTDFIVSFVETEESSGKNIVYTKNKIPTDYDKNLQEI